MHTETSPATRVVTYAFSALMLLVGLFGAADSSSAMVVVPAAFNEMAAASETIVHGRVVNVQSYQTAGRRTIETLVTVQVVDTIKGQPLATAYFRLPGGQVGRYRRVMVGAPECQRGDESRHDDDQQVVERDLHPAGWVDAGPGSLRRRSATVASQPAPQSVRPSSRAMAVAS